MRRAPLLGTILTGLCLLHCLGAAVLVPAASALAVGAAGEDSRELELGFWFLSAVAGLVVVRRPPVSRVAAALIGLALVAGAGGFWRDEDRWVQASLLVLLATQVLLLLRRRRHAVHAPGDGCCPAD